METKRQALKKRAEQTRLDSDSEINWDDVGDIGSPGGENDMLIYSNNIEYNLQF